jgi:hypothetical protein
VSVFGSARKVFAQFDHGWLWDRLATELKSMFPTDDTMHLPDTPMKRHHWTYFKRRYLTEDSVLRAQLEAFERAAAETALELGLADPNGAGSFSHPALERSMWADGKVITPLSRLKRGTSNNADPDARLHQTGTGPAYGNKFVLAGCRGPAVHERVILSLERVGKGGEAKYAVDCINRVASRLPGLHAAIYDGAMRGTHAAEVHRESGIHLVRPAIAERVAKDEEDTRLEKSRRLEPLEIVTADGELVRHELYARGGSVGIVEFDERGDPLFTALRRTRSRRVGRPGKYRVYNDYELPSELGGGSVALPVYQTAEDAHSNFNRLEYLHSIAPGDPDHDRLYRNRPNIEAVNRSLEDTLHINRAHSIGFGLMTNALAKLQAIASSPPLANVA